MNYIRRTYNKLLIGPKVAYFTLSLFFYLFHQFRSPFILENYNVGANLGLYIGIIQIIVFIAGIYIAAYNDRSGRQRQIILMLIIGAGILFQVFFEIKNTMLFFILYCVYSILISSTMPLLDKVVVDVLSQISNNSSRNSLSGNSALLYGRQRVFSSFGYVVNNFIVEGSIKLNLVGKSDFSNMKYLNILFGGFTFVTMYFFIKNLPRKYSETRLLSPIFILLSKFDFSFFIFIILLCGIGRAIMTIYLSSYMKDVLQFTNRNADIKTFYGLQHILDYLCTHKQSTTTLFGVIFEIIIFLFSSSIVGKFGLFLPLFIGVIAQFLRFIGYYKLHYSNEYSFVWVCAFELLKGFGFGLIQASAMQFVNKMAPQSMKTSAQFIFNGCYIALGTGLSGIIFKSVETNLLRDAAYLKYNRIFLINSIIAMTVVLLFTCKYVIYENLVFDKNKRDKKLSELVSEAEEQERCSAIVSDMKI